MSHELFEERNLSCQNLTLINAAFDESSESKRGGSVVSASDLGPEGREFEPWPVQPSCVLRQNT